MDRPHAVITMTGNRAAPKNSKERWNAPRNVAIALRGNDPLGISFAIALFWAAGRAQLKLHRPSGIANRKNPLQRAGRPC